MCVAAQLVDRGVSMHEREAAGRSALDLARAYGHYNLATQLLHTEASRRERQEKDRVKAVKTKIAADIAAQQAQEKYERFLRREAARKQREEDERREAAHIRAEADAVKKAADDARDAATVCTAALLYVTLWLSVCVCVCACLSVYVSLCMSLCVCVCVCVLCGMCVCGWRCITWCACCSAASSG